MVITISMVWLWAAVGLAHAIGLVIGLFDVVAHKGTYDTPKARIKVVLGATFWLWLLPPLAVLWLLRKAWLALLQSMVNGMVEDTDLVARVTEKVERQVAMNIGLLEPPSDGDEPYKPRWDISQWK